MECTKPDAAPVGETPEDSPELEDFVELTETQEESVLMLHQAILEAAENDVPGEILLFALAQAAAEFALIEGFSKKDFLQGAGALFDEVYEELLVKSASERAPIEE